MQKKFIDMPRTEIKWANCMLTTAPYSLKSTCCGFNIPPTSPSHLHLQPSLTLSRTLQSIPVASSNRFWEAGLGWSTWRSRTLYGVLPLYQSQWSPAEAALIRESFTTIRYAKTLCDLFCSVRFPADVLHSLIGFRVPSLMNDPYSSPATGVRGTVLPLIPVPVLPVEEFRYRYPSRRLNLSFNLVYALFFIVLYQSCISGSTLRMVIANLFICLFFNRMQRQMQRQWKIARYNSKFGIRT